MSEIGFDVDGFNRFEAAGWEERAHVYHRFFGPITTCVIEPLLGAAGIAAGKPWAERGHGSGWMSLRP